MLKRKYRLGIATLFATTLLTAGLSGCNAIKGFGSDITNAAQSGQNLINGDPITYNQTAYAADPGTQ